MTAIDQQQTMSDICNASDCEKRETNNNNGQCLMCHKIYHYECVNVKTATRSGANTTFVCTSCCQTVQELHNIKAQIQPISKLAHELREFHKEHVRLITEMQEKLHEKESENADLRSRVATLTVELQASKWGIFTKKPSDIVLSDSILGDVDQSKLVNTKMVSLSGGRVHTLQDELKKPEYHGAKYNNLTFMAGTNDLQDVNGDAEKVTTIIEKY